ncbi:hypothetical protein NQ317_007829 [Molorchus minor]|uniref:Uncharacterized protein n=1 Tax=Molorchus minor TaxID=1323400 RepID=A0ABQ9K482_9CUCU|nr:hypothetical protein NQ317_007829 [Molorchus minor]
MIQYTKQNDTDRESYPATLEMNHLTKTANVSRTKNHRESIHRPIPIQQNQPSLPSNPESSSNADRMVSPKRKVEHFQHLYVANNVKTSTFNEQLEKAICRRPRTI